MIAGCELALLPLILITFSYFAVAEELQRESVEEVLAVVGETPILLSDAELAALVRLVDREPGATSEDYRSRLLDARIRLEIQFRDLEEAGLLFRLDLEPEAVRGIVDRKGRRPRSVRSPAPGQRSHLAGPRRARPPGRGGRCLCRATPPPRVSVTMEEIEVAYQQLLVDEIATTDETLPPLPTVQEHLRNLLVERKLNDEIQSWLERATERQEVTRFSTDFPRSSVAD